VKIFYHMLDVFHMESPQKRKKISFKFNLVWLRDPKIFSFVQSIWFNMEAPLTSSPMLKLVSKKCYTEVLKRHYIV